MQPNPNAPDGYTVTLGPPDDVAELVKLVGAVQARYDGHVAASESFWSAMLADPRIDPIPNHLLITTADTGDLVGFGRYSNVAPHVESTTQGFVHPDHEGRGIGTYIVEWGLERSRTEISQAPQDARVRTLVSANATNIASADLFQEHNYSVDRYFFEMGRPLDDPVTVHPLPDGVTLRTMRGADDIEVIVDPVMEAFRDHYGHTESTRESEVEQWHRWRNTEEWDDSLVWIAEASGAPVAVNVAIRTLGARKDTGYIPSLSVVSQWRGQGIARALLTTAFAEFRRRGRSMVALHVDADSLTGATRLYEGVGMHETQRLVDYAHELRHGTDLVTR